MSITRVVPKTSVYTFFLSRLAPFYSADPPLHIVNAAHTRYLIT